MPFKLLLIATITWPEVCRSHHAAGKVSVLLSAAAILLAASPDGVASTVTALCQPSVGPSEVVASPRQRQDAARQASPPLTDRANGFAWPDTPISAIRHGGKLLFFASDGAIHAREPAHEHATGTGKAGSITRTSGTLEAPLGNGPPRDISISPNADPTVNPHFRDYTYIGAGPVMQIPAGQPGAGHLLAVYHAEILAAKLYPALGLAASDDEGLHWTDLGEIIRLNQPYAADLSPYDIGDGPLVTSPDGKYFYVYFPDWMASTTRHRQTNAPDAITNVSVARAPVAAVLQAAFASGRRSATRFEKLHNDFAHAQPGLGGTSTDLVSPNANHGNIDVHYNVHLARYIMIISNDTDFTYAESPDGLSWSPQTKLGTFGGNPAIAAYPTAIGLGEDPTILGAGFYVFYTLLPNDGTGWADASLRRVLVSCP